MSFDTDPWIYYQYDSIGNLTTIQDETGTFGQVFDFLNRLTTKQTISGTVYYQYDKTGKKSDLKDADLKETYYGYDSAGRLALVGLLDGTARWAYYTYDASGLVTKKTSPVTPPTAALVYSYYTYDNAARVSQLVHKLGSNDSIVNYFAYQRDANGNIYQTVFEAGGYQYYQYDALDRLTFDQRRNSSNTTLYGFYYNYDAASNRYFKYDEVANIATYFTFDARNLLTQSTDDELSPVTTNFDHDSSGRMTRQRLMSTSNTHYFTYNQRNMVTRIHNEKGIGSPDSDRYFTYNGLGERVWGIDGTSTPSYWTYDGSKVIRENLAATSVRYRQNAQPQDAMVGGPLEFLTSDNTTTANPAPNSAGTVKTLVASGNPPGNNLYEFNSYGELLGVTDAIDGTPSNRLTWLTPMAMALKLTSYIMLPAGNLYVPAANQLLVGGQMLVGNPESPFIVPSGRDGRGGVLRQQGAGKGHPPCPHPDRPPPGATWGRWLEPYPCAFIWVEDERDHDPCCGPDVTGYVFEVLRNIESDFLALPPGQQSAQCRCTGSA